MSDTSRKSRARSNARIPYGTYCLYCYAPMERTRVASEHCPACDHIVLRVDRERRWTLEPRFVRAEGFLILTIWLTCVVAFAYSALSELGFGLGHVIALPIVGGFLHVTASKLTHRLRGVRFDILWGVAAPGFVIFSFMVFFYLIATSDHGLEPPRSWRPYIGPFLFLCLLASSPSAVLLSRRIERWKARRVLAAMATHGAGS